MTNVTILNQYFYPENVTSATLTTELATGLVEKGIKVKAITGMPHEYHKGNVAKTDDKDGVRIERIDYSYHDRSTKIGRLRNYFSFFFAILRNRKLLLGTDVLIVYSSPPINPIIPALLSARYGYKMIYVVYDLYPDMAVNFGYMKKRGISARTFERINQFVYSKCSRIVVLSSDMEQYFAEHKGHAAKIATIPNWYGGSPGVAKEADPTNKHFSVLYGGNIGIVQDVGTLLDGMERISDNTDIDFIFAAHGNKKQDFFDEVQRRNITAVKDVGHLEKLEYDKIVSAADLAIVSVDEKIAGLASPSKYYSYLAKGIPVLFIGSSAMDIAKDIKTHEIGYAIPNHDAQAFADAILDAKDNPIKMKEMRNNALRLFKSEYTKNICIDKYAILIEQIVKEGNPC